MSGTAVNFHRHALSLEFLLLWSPKARIFWIQKSPFAATSVPGQVICEVYPHKSFCILHFEGEFLIFLQQALFIFSKNNPDES